MTRQYPPRDGFAMALPNPDYRQAANLRGFRASLISDLKVESQILWMESQILWKNSIHFNVEHRKVHWRNPKLKLLNSMCGLWVMLLAHIFCPLPHTVGNVQSHMNGARQSFELTF